MDLSKYKSNADATENGVWFFLDSEQKSGFLIARIGSKAYRESAARHITPHQQAIARGALSLEKQEGLLAKVLAEAVVLDWKGITDGKAKDGKPKDYPYSKEACEALLIAPEYQDLVRLITEFANQAENYRAEEILETGNESKPTSVGS